MTDNEIIKALECCTKGEDCTHCPLIEELPCFCIYCGNVVILRPDGKREPFCKECRDKRLGKV